MTFQQSFHAATCAEERKELKLTAADFFSLTQVWIIRLQNDI